MEQAQKEYLESQQEAQAQDNGAYYHFSQSDGRRLMQTKQRVAPPKQDSLKDALGRVVRPRHLLREELLTKKGMRKYDIVTNEDRSERYNNFSGEKRRQQAMQQQQQHQAEQQHQQQQQQQQQAPHRVEESKTQE